MRQARRPAGGEGSEALSRVVLRVTLAVGAVAGAAFGIIGDPLGLVGLPAVALAVALLRGSTTAAGYAAAVVWLVFVPRAPAEGILVPLAMIVASLAIALGPERMGAWLGSDIAPAPRAGGRRDGWIEEEPRQVRG